MATGKKAGGERCPACGVKGKRVRAVTLESLLGPDVRERLADLGALRFCATSDCDVVYFGSGDLQVGRGEVRVPVWQKEQDPDRPVCYCFGHTDREIRDQVASHGTSTVPDEIAEKCRQGLDQCEQENPQGTCCLGNIRSVVKQAQLGARDASGDARHSLARSRSSRTT